jgi:hypothetical protein
MPAKKSSKDSRRAAKPAYSRPKPKNAALRKLEGDIVKRQGKMSEADFEDVERKVLEGKRQNTEGMGIEEEEDAGQEPYPEIEDALKDPEESGEEDEDKL